MVSDERTDIGGYLRSILADGVGSLGDLTGEGGFAPALQPPPTSLVYPSWESLVSFRGMPSRLSSDIDDTELDSTLWTEAWQNEDIVAKQANIPTPQSHVRLDNDYSKGGDITNTQSSHEPLERLAPVPTQASVPNPAHSLVTSGSSPMHEARQTESVVSEQLALPAQQWIKESPPAHSSDRPQLAIDETVFPSSYPKLQSSDTVNAATESREVQPVPRAKAFESVDIPVGSDDKQSTSSLAVAPIVHVPPDLSDVFIKGQAAPSARYRQPAPDHTPHVERRAHTGPDVAQINADRLTPSPVGAVESTPPDMTAVMPLHVTKNQTRHNSDEEARIFPRAQSTNATQTAIAAPPGVVTVQQAVVARVEQLRQTTETLTARLAAHEEKSHDRNQTHQNPIVQPPPVQPILIVQQRMRSSGEPPAFWARSYLSRPVLGVRR